MNIDKQLAGIPTMSAPDRASLRANAMRLAGAGTQVQKTSAVQLLAALDGQEQADSAALYKRLKDQPVAKRVVEAFRIAPMSDNERKTIQALLDHPGATTTELSRACGHDGMIWQMHFGNLCKDRQAYLWPAEKAGTREGLFFSSILADIDGQSNRFTMKPDVVAAFAELGLKVAPR
jgi:hypothetical protein